MENSSAREPGAPIGAQALAEQENWRRLMSPAVQCVAVRMSSGAARVLRVEQLLLQLLEEVTETPEQWPASYGPAERAMAAPGARQAVERSRLLLGRLGVDVDFLVPALHQAARRAAVMPMPTHTMSRDSKRVWQLAGEEARAMDSPLIWPEHLVLAIVRWGRPRPSWSVWPIKRDLAEQVLAPLNIDLNVARVVARDQLAGEIEASSPWTIRVQKAIDAAHGLAIKTHCGRIAPAHLLLALLGDEEDARQLLAHLEASEVDLPCLHQEVRACIRGDGEASTAQPRFSKDSARALDRCKAMCARAGFKRMDEAGLLLSLALHGGESVEPWRQVLGDERARAQVKKWCPRARTQRAADSSGWKPPKGALDWTAFLTAPLCWPLGTLMFVVAGAGGGRSSIATLGVILILIPMAWMIASIFALLLGRPPAFKQACESFLSGVGLLAMLYIGGSFLWNLLRALLRL